MNDIMRRRYFFYLRAISALLCFFFWFRLVRSEVRGHTVHMSVSFRNRFAWFLVSEAMLFFRFFWCYFHNTLNVDLVTRRFPNFRVVVLDAWGVPLFNTMVLLSSRFTLTFRHQALVLRFNDRVRFRMIITIIQRIIFTYYQYEEYCESSFTIASRSFRSIFFMATRFHRFHVLVRTSFLIYNLFRVFKYEYSPYRHIRFEMRVWYWHFVDIIWLFLFFFVYAVN